MAKIFIVGRLPIEVSQDDAIRINEMWIASQPKGKEHLIDKILEAGGQTFLSKDIKGFDLTSGMIKQGIDEYDLHDEAQKAKVKAFEREFEGWKSKHPEITEWHEYEFLQAQGVLKMGKHRPDDEIVVGEKYREFKKLLASLQTLKYYREKAQADNDPDYEAKRVAMFQTMKEQMFGKREPAPNPVLEKLKADAKSFDEKCGIVGDVDVKDIPF